MAFSMMEIGIFRQPRPKKSVLPPQLKKRRLCHKIDEISFDDVQREDYLTGFHKRKLLRIKRAQEEYEKKAREERREMRKQLREERKEELEEHVEAVNRALQEVDVGFQTGDKALNVQEDAWEGIDHRQEYVDEDRYTTVTVESVNISKEGIQTLAVEDSGDEASEKSAPFKGSLEKKKSWPKKPKKKGFRYESKAERRITSSKQKAGNKAKAMTRKSN